MRSIFIKLAFACAVCVASAAGLRGQSSADMPTQTTTVMGRFVGPGILFPMVREVKGAPFSGFFRIESKQVLADGNTITNTRTGKLARDGEGRTYNETTVAVRVVGANHGTFTTININDPVSGAQFTLLPETHTARRLETVQRAVMPSAEPADARLTPGNAKEVMTRTPELTRGSLPAVQKEDLGVESIDGIDVRHYRETQTIPAGELGNERDLVITAEFWYTKDLRMNLKATRNDPRFGEDTLTVTEVQRTEPPLTMFEIPADYTVVESNMGLTGVTSAGPVIAVAPAAPGAKP